MISVKCNNCAGELSIDVHGELVCPYCGSKTHFSDMELKEYKELRLNILNALRSMNDTEMDKADDNSVWNTKERISFVTTEGTVINIDYTFCYEEDGVRTFITKDSVIHVFKASEPYKADDMISSIRKLDYPSAALKDLSRYFPTVKGKFNLNDGGVLLALAKPENVYPLFAFGNLRPVHVAWIISRMENFCCVFEYSQIVHRGISMNSVFINPKTHEAFLYGGWWKAKRKYDVDKTDLRMLRDVATKVTGDFMELGPKMYQEFLKNEPADIAYDDFADWDDVIERGFGGHNFRKFEQG